MYKYSVVTSYNPRANYCFTSFLLNLCIINGSASFEWLRHNGELENDAFLTDIEIKEVISGS